MGATLAACALPGQVPASEPHGVVRVAIHHHGQEARFVEDTLVLDGYRIDVTDKAKPVALRLAPGKHQLELASNAIEFRNEVDRVQVGYSCAYPKCIVTVPIIEDRMQLQPTAVGPICWRAFPIEVTGGDTIDVRLDVDDTGHCL
jgi:hypothetical protein